MTGDLRREAVDFLTREARLLDNRELEAWFDLLSEDLDYRAPIRVTREDAQGPYFSDDSFHFKETHGSMKARVDRFKTEYAWSEDPPSRTRRFVSNFEVEELDDGDGAHVISNLLIYRSQGDTEDADLISGEREDTLRREDGDLKLASREIRLDHTTLGTHNLSIFL